MTFSESPFFPKEQTTQVFQLVSLYTHHHWPESEAGGTAAAAVAVWAEGSQEFTQRSAPVVAVLYSPVITFPAVTQTHTTNSLICSEGTRFWLWSSGAG